MNVNPDSINSTTNKPTCITIKRHSGCHTRWHTVTGYKDIYNRGMAFKWKWCKTRHMAILDHLGMNHEWLMGLLWRAKGRHISLTKTKDIRTPIQQPNGHIRNKTIGKSLVILDELECRHKRLNKDPKKCNSTQNTR